jgi:hypothetical protein
LVLTGFRPEIIPPPPVRVPVASLVLTSFAPVASVNYYASFDATGAAGSAGLHWDVARSLSAGGAAGSATVRKAIASLLTASTAAGAGVLHWNAQVALSATGAEGSAALSWNVVRLLSAVAAAGSAAVTKAVSIAFEAVAAAWNAALSWVKYVPGAVSSSTPWRMVICAETRGYQSGKRSETINICGEVRGYEARCWMPTVAPREDYMVFEKGPEAVLDYYVDWSPALQAGETLASSTWSLASGLTEVKSYITGKKAYCWISGGTVGTSYVCTNTVVTSLGRQYVEQFKIEVKYR